MKYTFAILLILAFNLLFSQAYLKPIVEQAIQQSNQELIPVIIKLKSQVDVNALKKDLLKQNVNLQERRKVIVKALYNANYPENDFDIFLHNLQNSKSDEIKDIKKFWAVNAVSCKATAEMIDTILTSSEIDYIQYDLPVKGEKVTEGTVSGDKSMLYAGGAEKGLVAIHSRAMWNLGYTGRNRIAMNIDTGVSLDHPTIGNRFLGYYLPLSQTWLGFESPSPYDIDRTSFHGTHTMGTMVGLDTATADTIGVAFNAFWIASDPVVTTMADVRPLSDYFIPFQWALNPDGDTATSSDIPDVINNSWGVDYPYWANTWQADCDPIEYDFIVALEAADCAVIFSNGNDGPNSTTTGMPAGITSDSLNIFAIGALDGNSASHNIADFSSRGPSNCDLVSPIGIKPEVSAPGVNVRSASGNGTYKVLSGTSMASPHVSGAILLLREAFPNVSSFNLKNALYQTAHDLGDVGEDNTYGRGLIDVYDAYLFLSQTYTPTPPISNQFDIAIDSILGYQKTVCQQNNNYDVIIKNKGTDVLSDFVFRVILNTDTIIETNINVSLQANETYTIPVNIDLLDLNNEIDFGITKSSISEFNIYNNYKSYQVKRLFVNSIPYYEDFETMNSELSDANFDISNSDFKNTWLVDSTEGIAGSYRSLKMPFYDYLPGSGQHDVLSTGAFEIPSSGNTYLYFKHAYTQKYNYRKDSLYLIVSPSCSMIDGDTIFMDGGANLKTTSSNVSGAYKPTLESEWIDQAINLTNYLGQTIFLKFIAVNDASNNLFIDELRIENGIDLTSNSIRKSVIKYYPNPTNGDLFFENLKDGTSISVYDLSGKLLLTKNIQAGKISLSQLEKGIYFIKYKANRIGKIVLL